MVQTYAMGASGASSSSSTNDSSSSSKTDLNKTLDKNAFLKILMTQMENQDPMNPMDSTQYVSQMAQFSSLEQMTNMNETLATVTQTLNLLSQMQTTTQALTLVGRTVTLKVTDDSGAEQTITGKVDGIKFDSGTPKLVVNGNDYGLGSVVSLS